MPEPDADWEMTRPLSAREMASIVGELFGKVGVFAALALVLMLAADDVLRLFPQIQGTLRWPIVYGVGYCGSYMLLYFLKRRGHA